MEEGALMKIISWEEALRVPNLDQGEIEVQVFSDLKRGPISRVSVENNDVLFHLRWCAESDVAISDWIASPHATVIIFNMKETEVSPARDGRLIITGKNITVATIHPKGGERLDPEEVFGLDLNNLPQPIAVEIG